MHTNASNTFFRMIYHLFGFWSTGELFETGPFSRR